ncbi:MAG: DUF1194 domain-containing protein [Alphaproteobacteria bacterium]|nr:DUF1194 domain-containing protein [Alphaproteobacteria bacterium]TAD87928.1 MAG: DUF1194 domain-containing protein [Alphaproteobacteria bacterium]
MKQAQAWPMPWLVLILLVLIGPPALARSVDVALVLAIDSSSSINTEEFALQREGLAAAFRDPDVQALMTAGPQGAVAVTILEWSDASWQEVAEPWRVLDGAAAAEALAADLDILPRRIWGGATAIGAALVRARAVLAEAPAAGRRVIDVSGDGSATDPRRLATIRAQLQAEGVTVNGLAILGEEANLDTYYQAEVITGPGAFMIVAKDFSDFARAFRIKLLRELQPGPVAQVR